MRSKPSTPPAAPFRTAAISARSRSIRKPARRKSSPTRWSMTPARIINPMVVEGQLHGGVAQGIGQAMMEHAIWEPDSGQMISRLVHGLRDAARRYGADLSRDCCTKCRPPSTRLASKASAKPAPPLPRPPSSTPSSTRSQPYGILHVPMPATAVRDLAGDPGGEAEGRLKRCAHFRATYCAVVPRAAGPVAPRLPRSATIVAFTDLVMGPAFARSTNGGPNLTRPARNPCACRTARRFRKSRTRRC